MKTYTLTARIRCERCAIALAGHAPGLGTVRSVMVTVEEPDGSALTLHANSPTMQAHDGSPLACPEHGVLMDLAHEPGQAKLPLRQAHRGDPTAHALRALLDQVRSERESASLAHAVASAADREGALHASVAASAGEDVALHALTSYVAHGFYQPRLVLDAEESPLHERCRIARNAVMRRIIDIFTEEEPS